MTKLVTDNTSYKDEVLKVLEHRIKTNKVFLYVLRVLTFLGAFASVIIVSLIMGKIIYSSYPTWFFFATASITSVIAFITSLINFFVLKDNLEKYKKEKELVNIEILKHENGISKRYKSKDKDFNLNISIGVIVGSKPAKKERSNG